MFIKLVLISTIGKSLNIQIIINNISLKDLTESFGTYATVGNYSHYIPDYNLCGHSINSLQTDSKCFDYHKKVFAPIVNGRDTRTGETPWVVYVSALIDHPWFNYWLTEYRFTPF